jgi:hypothetical protein
LRYSFEYHELNNWVASLTERLVECYIKDILAVSLKNEGWDDIVYMSAWFKTNGSKLPSYAYTKLDEREEKREELMLLGYGFFPTNDLLRVFKRLTSSLKNDPDGFLVKLKRTGKSKNLKSATKKFGLDFEGTSYTHFLMGKDIFGSRQFAEMFLTQTTSASSQLPEVNGEIEVVEVKTGKAYLPSNQRESYLGAIRNGFHLRLFHVDIVSMSENHFEIKEKLVKTEREFDNIMKKEVRKSIES